MARNTQEIGPSASRRAQPLLASAAGLRPSLSRTPSEGRVRAAYGWGSQLDTPFFLKALFGARSGVAMMDRISNYERQVIEEGIIPGDFENIGRALAKIDIMIRAYENTYRAKLLMPALPAAETLQRTFTDDSGVTIELLRGPK